MPPINESIVFTAIRQCLETADHYIRQGNRRDAEFYLNTADAYANRLIASLVIASNKLTSRPLGGASRPACGS